MSTFILNVPIVTSEPTIAVEGIPPGTHRFQLIVEDESGNRSQPSFGTVTVLSHPPVVTSVSPAFGFPGDLVVITGANFDPVPNVSFSGFAATVESASRTQLTVRVPKAVTGLLKVTTGTGQVLSSTFFVIPRVFTVELGNADIASQPVDLALDSVKANLWVLNKGPVINSNRGTVEVINLETRKRLKIVFVGAAPKEIAVAAAGERRLCVVLNSDVASAIGVVSAIDLDTMEVVATIRFQGNAIAMDISPDAKWVYVLVSVAPSGLPASINVIDMIASRVVNAIPVGRTPTRVVFSRDGQFAVVNNTGDGTISIISVATHKVVGVVKAGTDASIPQEAAFSGNNFPIWTANFGSRNASVINKEGLATNIELDFGPMTVAVNTKGTRAFFMGPREKMMVVVDTSAGQPAVKKVSTFGVGSSVKGIATNPDDSGVVAIHPDTNAMSVLETKTLSVRAIINVPATPSRCLVSSDGQFAAVVCSKTLFVLEMESVLPIEA